MNTLIKVSLWGNKSDLSFSAGDSQSTLDNLFKEMDELRSYILVDDLDEACDKYLTGFVF